MAVLHHRTYPRLAPIGGLSCPRPSADVCTTSPTPPTTSPWSRTLFEARRAGLSVARACPPSCTPQPQRGGMAKDPTLNDDRKPCRPAGALGVTANVDRYREAGPTYSLPVTADPSIGTVPTGDLVLIVPRHAFLLLGRSDHSPSAPRLPRPSMKFVQPTPVTVPWSQRLAVQWDRFPATYSAKHD